MLDIFVIIVVVVVVVVVVVLALLVTLRFLPQIQNLQPAVGIDNAEARVVAVQADLRRPALDNVFVLETDVRQGVPLDGSRLAGYD